MRLPHHDQALVEGRKVIAYLLSEENSGGKAAFFAGLGFIPTEWQVLRVALIAHATNNEVTAMITTPHGTKYIIEGALVTPDGRSAIVRAVWIVDSGAKVPRLVTAYPLARGDS